MESLQDTFSLTPEPDNALFSTQLESLMRHDFFGDVPVSVVGAAQQDSIISNQEVTTLARKSGISIPSSEAVDSLDDLAAMMKQEFFPEPDPELTGSFYRPLKGEDEIRLLCLEPGKFGGLKGKLVHVHLADNPTYEALSYAWGPAFMSHEITFPQGILRITESLSSGLMHLRRGKKERLLWIDQLCINQEDKMEKTQQIMLMRQIYSSAGRVLVWLGADEGNGSIALGLLKQIGKLETNTLQSRSVSAPWMAANGFPPSGDGAWFALLNFWRRLWFRRAWVVQEFILAEDALMICGKTQLGWQEFISGHEKMMQYSLLDLGTIDAWNIQEERSEAWSGSMSLTVMLEIKNMTRFGPSIANVIRSYSERDETGLEELQISSWGKWPLLKEVVMKLREVPEATKPITQWLSQSIERITPHEDKIRLPLCHLLLLFSKSEATNARDRLFAFLGLALDGHEIALRPNYDDYIESVFLRYANYFVRSGNGIQVLHLSSGLSNRNVYIPTWVPDWTQTELLESRQLNNIASTRVIYKAAADTTPNIRCTNNEREIVLSAVHVGIISRTAVSTPGIPSDDSWYFRLQHFFEEADTFILKRGSYVTGEPLFDVQWKTLIGNSSTDNGFGPPGEYGQQYLVCKNIIENLKPEGPFPRWEDMNGYLKRLFTFMPFYKLCETETGYVGIVPLQAEVGDSVYVPVGGTLPFVLRPNEEIQNKFLVVGGCYVHGVMKGELVGSETWKEEDIILQ